MNKETAKKFASFAGWVVVLTPVSLMILIVCIVLLDISFGIVPPAGLVAGSLILSLTYGFFWRIGNSLKRQKKPARVNSSKRLLRVQFLQKRG